MSDTLAAPTATEEKPPIVVRRSEHGRLYAIAMGAMLRAPRAAGSLLDELQRCQVLDDAEVEDAVAGIQSTVVYRDESDAGRPPGCVTIVMPMQADPRLGQISVLSSLGAALLGLRPGQSILWNDRRGYTTRLTILEVRKGGHPAPRERR